MAEWCDCTLGNLVDVKHGYAFLGEHFGSAGSHIVLTPGNFFDEGGFKKKGDREKWYTGPIPKDYVLKEGDLIVAMTEQAEGLLGSSAIVPHGGLYLHNQRLGLVRLLDESKTDRRFVYYLFNSKPVRQQIRASASGVKIRHTAPSRIADVRVSVPALRQQQRIAGILSAYDELMENNQRRIQILETMARALYREWFVEFRFPGHEKIPRVASAVGDIPKGWEAVPFEILLASMTGGDWGSDQPTERESAEVRIVRGTDFNEVAYGGELRAPFRFIKPSSLKSRGLRPGDVIVENSINAKSRCVGTTLLVDQELLARIGRSAVAASFCKVFRLHDPRIAPLVHLHIRGLRQEGRMEYYQNVATNGIGNFQAQTFAKEEHLILPKNESLRSKLLERIDQMFECVGVMSSQLAYLRRTRDLLLPRLLSGQVTLTDTAA